jgi:hypothetical protein
MLQRSRKHRNTSTGPALAGTSGAAFPAVDRPQGIGAVDSDRSQYMRRPGLARARVILEGGQLPQFDYSKMATTPKEVRPL